MSKKNDNAIPTIKKTVVDVKRPISKKDLKKKIEELNSGS